MYTCHVYRHTIIALSELHMKGVEDYSRKTDRMKTEAGLHLEKLSKGGKSGQLKEGGIH